VGFVGCVALDELFRVDFFLGYSHLSLLKVSFFFFACWFHECRFDERFFFRFLLFFFFFSPNSVFFFYVD